MGSLISPTDSFTGTHVRYKLGCHRVCNSLFTLCRVAQTWENVNTDHADVKEVSFNPCVYIYNMYMYIHVHVVDESH